MDRPARELRGVEPSALGALRSILNAECGVQPMVGCNQEPQCWGENVKRVNLIDYFDLSEQLGRAKTACSAKTSKAGSIYFSVFLLEGKLNAFINDDNGFSTSKHPARELADG